MKIRFALCAFIICALLFPGVTRAGHPLFSFLDPATTPQGVRAMELYPIGAPYTNGAGAIVTRDWVSRTTGPDGTITISNIYGGPYMGVFHGTKTNTTVYYNFPVTNVVFNAADYVRTPTNYAGILAYTEAQSDARFNTNLGITGIGANLSIVSGILVASGGGGAGGTPYRTGTNASMLNVGGTNVISADVSHAEVIAATNDLSGVLVTQRTAATNDLNTVLRAALVPQTRSLTINGSTLDLSADRTFLPTTATPQFARIGIGGAADATHLVKVTGGTVTADTHVWDGSQTWNSSGVTFTGFLLNIVNTASAGASKVFDWQVNGVTKASMSVAGTLTASAFSGVGSSLTSLNANNLASGTVPAAQMPALTGDVTSSAGSVATTLKNTGTAGTYTKTTFDAQGRETSGTSAVLASADYANQGTTTTVLHGNAAGNPSFAAVSLSADVTGTLPLANGGAGAALTDPNANTFFFWDDTDNAFKFVTLGSGFTYDHASHTVSVSSGGGGTVTATGGALTANAMVLGAGSTDAKVVPGIISDGTSQLTLGVAGTSVGSIAYKNATSGTLTVSPPTGAMGTIAVTWPNASSTLPIFGQQITFSGPTAARTVTFPDANFTAARTDAAQTFTGVQTFSSAPVLSSTTASQALLVDGSKAVTSVAYTGSGNVMRTRTGVYRTFWVPAGAMIPTSGAGPAPGTNAPAGTDTFTGDVYDFDDTTSESAQFQWVMPDEWDLGNIKFKVHWTTASGTGGVVWGMAGGAIGDNGAFGTALGTEVTVTDTRQADNVNHISPASGALTVGNTPALGKLCNFKVRRLPADAGDTKVGDARLIGVEIQYLETTTEQAIW